MGLLQSLNSSSLMPVLSEAKKRLRVVIMAFSRMLAESLSM